MVAQRKSCSCNNKDEHFFSSVLFSNRFSRLNVPAMQTVWLPTKMNVEWSGWNMQGTQSSAQDTHTRPEMEINIYAIHKILIHY